MKKMLAIMAACALATSVMAQNALLNPGFMEEGDGGGSWSAEFWGDGSTAAGVMHGRSDGGNFRDPGPGGRDWVMKLHEMGQEQPHGEIWQQHTVGAGLAGMGLSFSGDFYLGADADGLDTLKAELGFFDGDGVWINDAEVLIDLEGTLDGSRETWHTLSVDAIAPANAEAFQVTLGSGTWGGNDDWMAVDNLSVIPEPMSAGLLGLGVAMIYFLRRKVKK